MITNTWKALITPRFINPGDEAERVLNNGGVAPEFNHWRAGRSENEMIALLRDKVAVVASSDPYTAKVMDGCPDLKIIARVGVGYDEVDVNAATERGIVVTTTPGCNHRSVAEFAMALMLQCARRMAENLQLGRDGEWTWVQGDDMAGKTLGIIGLGTIGKEVAKRARAFDMNVVAYDIVRDDAFAAAHDVTYAGLEDVLIQADFVTLHSNLDDTSRHMINGARLALMKPTAYLVNTSRGGVVDGKALYEALKANQIAAAAFDVFETEPLASDDPLRSLDNLYITGHAAGASHDARKAAARMAAENVVRVLNGVPPHTVLNPEVIEAHS
jgi:phosphoglycerate dehydrogenase-like enzyme